MVVGEVAEGVDLLVVGGGPGGYTAAVHAARIGREVTLVDEAGEAGLGGVCLHTGCIPSKALIEVADTVHRPSLLAAAGIGGSLTADMAVFQDWSALMIEQLRAGVQGMMRQHRIRVMHGQLTFNKPRRAVVATPDGNASFLEFESAIIATGSRPAPLATLPWDGVRVLSSAQALALREVPASMAIVGGGYVGVEIGTAFAKLGSAVTIVEQAEAILPGFDQSITGPVRRSMQRLGMRMLLGAEVREATEQELLVTAGGVEHAVPAAVIVVAAGRQSNTDNLGLAAAEISVRDDGRVRVNSACLAAPHIAAIGDIAPGPALAHKATAEAEVAALTVSGRRARFDPAAIPEVVFSDPEIAIAGMSERVARGAGIDVATGQFSLAASARARSMGAADGMVRVIADRDQDVVIGVQLAGPRVSELAAEAALAIEMGASPGDLAATIHPHPTISEALAAAAAQIAS